MAKYEPRNIECKKVKPHFQELILRCGDAKKAAEYAGISEYTFYRIRHEENRTMRFTTAQKILDALVRKREEDRINRTTSPMMRRVIQQQARIEDRMSELDC